MSASVFFLSTTDFLEVNWMKACWLQTSNSQSPVVKVHMPMFLFSFGAHQGLEAIYVGFLLILPISRKPLPFLRIHVSRDVCTLKPKQAPTWFDYWHEPLKLMPVILLCPRYWYWFTEKKKEKAFDIVNLHLLGTKPLHFGFNTTITGLSLLCLKV